MANNAKQKVGSSPDAARNFGSDKDFGAKEDDRVERDYASKSIRSQDPGAQPGRSTGDGQRTAGVGANDSGPGSGSGGDLDTDIIGVGTGGSGVATSGKIHDPSGPDDAQQTSQRKDRVIEHGVSKAVEGTTFDRSPGDASTIGEGDGAGAVTNAVAGNDDASVGEISNDEAAGADNSPSDRA